jgi:hypothetical protein
MLIHNTNDKITIKTAEIMIFELNSGLKKGVSISLRHRIDSPHPTDLNKEMKESEIEI